MYDFVAGILDASHALHCALTTLLPQKELLLIWGLLTTLVVITYFIQRYQWHFVPPSGIAMVLGMVAGMIFRLSGVCIGLCYVVHHAYTHTLFHLTQGMHLACVFHKLRFSTHSFPLLVGTFMYECITALRLHCISAVQLMRRQCYPLS